jgi:hypothetical protein
MLTGTWIASGTGPVSVPLSFPIHLAGNVTVPNIYYGGGTEEAEIEVSPGVFEKTEFQKHCLNAPANPAVAEGNSRTLCVYYWPAQSTAASFVGVSRNGTLAGAHRAGGILELNITTPGAVYGSFAVSGG